MAPPPPPPLPTHCRRVQGQPVPVPLLLICEEGLHYWGARPAAPSTRIPLSRYISHNSGARKPRSPKTHNSQDPQTHNSRPKLPTPTDQPPTAPVQFLSPSLDCRSSPNSALQDQTIDPGSSMANWHARDICGCLLLLLVFTEAARKWAFVQDLSNVHLNQVGLSQDATVHQVARRLLEPQVKLGYQPTLCRAEQECEEGVGVTCMQGNVVACSCDFIEICYPHVKKCSVYNSTHEQSCGF